MLVTYHVAGIVTALFLGLLTGIAFERSINMRAIGIMFINVGLTWLLVTIWGLLTQY